MKKLKVYVGCALTHAPEEYRQMIADFKNELRKAGWIEVLDFVTANSVLELPDPVHIYHNDIHECVGYADAFIADVTLPSLGLGWELGTAIEKHAIPTFMCAREGVKISNLVLGAPGKNTHTTLIRYKETIHEFLPKFLEEFKQLHENV
jgi:hypothetical protein